MRVRPLSRCARDAPAVAWIMSHHVTARPALPRLVPRLRRGPRRAGARAPGCAACRAQAQAADAALSRGRGAAPEVRRGPPPTRTQLEASPPPTVRRWRRDVHEGCPTPLGARAAATRHAKRRSTNRPAPRSAWRLPPPGGPGRWAGQREDLGRGPGGVWRYNPCGIATARR